jgi:hypothetical protein
VQIANRKGLRPRLDRVDRILKVSENITEDEKMEAILSLERE